MKVSYVVELSKPGAICGYILECGSFNTSSNSDYFRHFEANYKFRGEYTHWSKDLIDINSVIPFKLTFCYDVEDEYVSQIFEYNSFLIVAHQNENSCKENTQQLTGPSDNNFSPRFSSDGSTILYMKKSNNNSIYKTDKNGINHDLVLDFNNLSAGQPLYCSVDNNKIATIEKISGEEIALCIFEYYGSNPEKYSFNIINNSGLQLTHITDGNKYLYAFVGSNKYNLILLDLDSSLIDTIYSGNNKIYNFSYDSSSNKVAINYLNEIKEFDLITKESRNIITSIRDIYRFQYLPENQGYVYARIQNNECHLYSSIGGIEKQITFFSEFIFDVSVSSDGNYVLLYAKRRDEYQSWIVKL